jgi:hypothetical protein
VVVFLFLASLAPLLATDATPEVVGGGVFLVIMWLGLPAVVLVLLTLFFSLKAVDWQCILLCALVVIACIAVALSAPTALLGSIGLLYVLLVLGLGLHRRRKR